MLYSLNDSIFQCISFFSLGCPCSRNQCFSHSWGWKCFKGRYNVHLPIT